MPPVRQSPAPGSSRAPLIVVPTGEYRVAQAPGDLTTRDLGSCVGVSIYSPISRAGGLIHVAMPDSGIGSKNPCAHADVAIVAVIRRLESLGVMRSFFEVKMAGGSNMYGFEVIAAMDIGTRNIASIRAVLADEGLATIEEDVILDHPRSMTLELATGRVLLGRGGEIYRMM